MKTVYTSESLGQTVALGKKIGKNLKGGEVIELLSDLGGGKTTFVTGLADGFGSRDPVASPSFTISYTYSREDDMLLHHFDFYRLNEAGVVGAELEEFLGDPSSVVVIEWGEIVHDVLPEDRIKITILAVDDSSREITIEASKNFTYILNGVSV